MLAFSIIIFTFICSNLYIDVNLRFNGGNIDRQSINQSITFFLFKQYFISRKWIGQQAYKPIISPLLLLVGLVKPKI